MLLRTIWLELSSVGADGRMKAEMLSPISTDGRVRIASASNMRPERMPPNMPRASPPLCLAWPSPLVEQSLRSLDGTSICLRLFSAYVTSFMTLRVYEFHAKATLLKYLESVARRAAPAFSLLAAPSPLSPLLGPTSSPLASSAALPFAPVLLAVARGLGVLMLVRAWPLGGHEEPDSVRGMPAVLAAEPTRPSPGLFPSSPRASSLAEIWRGSPLMLAPARHIRKRCTRRSAQATTHGADRHQERGPRDSPEGMPGTRKQPARRRARTVSLGRQGRRKRPAAGSPSDIDQHQARPAHDPTSQGCCTCARPATVAAVASTTAAVTAAKQV
eukprot:scaffold884_cov398-Prasinococcus_capsulatus_cf.AAC.19